VKIYILTEEAWDEFYILGCYTSLDHAKHIALSRENAHRRVQNDHFASLPDIYKGEHYDPLTADMWRQGETHPTNGLAMGSKVNHWWLEGADSYNIYERRVIV